jgi:hypothetical protein
MYKCQECLERRHEAKSEIAAKGTKSAKKEEDEIAAKEHSAA